MKKQRIILPTVEVVEEWSEKTGGHAFVFEIKMISGCGQPDWYPTTCRDKDNSSWNVRKKIYERPSRKQVADRFADDLKRYIRTGKF
jgi:hypothetical protein